MRRERSPWLHVDIDGIPGYGSILLPSGQLRRPISAACGRTGSGRRQQTTVNSGLSRYGAPRPDGIRP
jgi:hypothetical protein